MTPKKIFIFLSLLPLAFLPLLRALLFTEASAGAPDVYAAAPVPASFNAAAAYAVAGIVFAVGLIFIFFRKSRSRRIIGFTLASLGAAGSIAIFFIARNAATPAPVFSARTMLGSLWENYKGDYIDPQSGRTVDKQQNDITTSEGESYTMLRAVWMDDKPTFDASWAWTQQNLQWRDGLFSWLYGRRADGTSGIIVERGGANTATDADTDIAVALLFAYSRWENEAYLKSALPIISSIWGKEVIQINGRPYITSQNIVNPADRQLLNPSYFAPYAYRMFSVVDGSHDWLSLVDSSYEVLGKSISQPFNGENSADLPPDWIAIDSRTGNLSAAPAPLSANFSFDALRVPWRLALDWNWYGDPRAKSILNRLTLLKTQWRTKRMIDETYAHNGSVITPAESPAMYGGSMGFFTVADPADAKEVYEQKLAALYDPDTQRWKEDLGYYNSNIAWFGMALYNDALPNLFNLNFR